MESSSVRIYFKVKLFCSREETCYVTKWSREQAQKYNFKYFFLIIIRCSGMFRNVPCTWFNRRPSYIAALNAATIYSTQKLSALADVSSFSACAINLLLLIVESGVYFGNKFWLPVFVLEAHRMKSSMLRQKQP